MNEPFDSPADPATQSEETQAHAAGRKRARRMARRGREENAAINMVPSISLFGAIVCFLFKSYSVDPVQIQSTPDTVLPFSTSRLSPQEAVQVAISGKVILVNDKVVARVQNGRVPVDYKRDRNPASMVITPLYEALKAEGDKQRMFARYNKKKAELQFKGLLTVIADKRIPFRLLTEVLYTAGQAEYGSYKFAVLKKAG